MFAISHVISLEVSKTIIKDHVVTYILYLQGQKLHAFKGDYDTIERTRVEQPKNQHKAFESNERSKAHMQALDRMAHVDEVINDPDYKFEFPGPDDRPGAPIIIFSDASFAYPGGSTLFRNLNFGIDLDSRVAMVGPNGIGKSTILKLISGELQPSSGTVFRSAKVYPGMPEQKLRGHLGSFGITGNLALQPMHTMFGGQKSRVAFSKITFKKPHILLLDESSNHIDLDAVEALIQGLVLFQGGVLMATSSAVMQTAGVDTTEKQLSTGKNVQDSELMAAFKDPEVMAALQDGIARQRQAIVEGIRDSVIAFCRNVPGIPAKDVVDMVLVTQYFDTIREIGATSKSSAVFIPHERICDGLLQALVMV